MVLVHFALRVFACKLGRPPEEFASEQNDACQYQPSVNVGGDGAETAASMHSARPIGRFGSTDQHFLGIAAAQRAGPAERAMVDHRHRPPRAPDARGNHLCGGAGADDNKVVAVHLLPFAPLFAAQADSNQPGAEDQSRNEYITGLGQPGG